MAAPDAEVQKTFNAALAYAKSGAHTLAHERR